MYKVVFDVGKPWEEAYDDDDALFHGLKDFYETHKDDDYPYEVLIYNERGEDISEEQFVIEMVAEIMGGEL